MIADALVTCASLRSSYTAVRSLARLGLRVVVADTSGVGMGQWSRIAGYAGRYAFPLTQPEQFVEDISALLEKTGARFLLPSHDETEVLAKYRNSLPAGVILPVAEYEQITFANDKARTMAFAASAGLPVPPYLDWRTAEELEHFLKNAHTRVVVKLRRGNSAKGVHYPARPADVEPLCRALIEKYRLLPERYPLVQEYVQGEGWGVSCLYWQGRRLASFTHRRLREKIVTGGTSTLRESSRNPLLEDYAHRLLDALNWHGLAMVEFKYDPISGKGWFIEINPRLWGSIHLAVAAGVDFPALLYFAALDGPQQSLAKAGLQREGVIARWYLGDVIAAAGEIAHGRLGNALKWILPGGADTYDDWHWDDPGVFLGQAANYLARFLQSRELNPELEGMLW